MKIQGTISSDEVDQIIADHLKKEYNIDARQCQLELKWIGCDIEFIVITPKPKIPEPGYFDRVD